MLCFQFFFFLNKELSHGRMDIEKLFSVFCLMCLFKLGTVLCKNGTEAVWNTERVLLRGDLLILRPNQKLLF